MKNIFRAFTIMILAFVLWLPMQTIVKASTYTDNVVNASNNDSVNNLISPSVVLELGSLSNTEEETLLNSEENQENVAKSIYSGSMKYAGAQNTDTNSDSAFTVSSVENIMVNLEEGCQYTFPETVQVIMTNNIKKEVEVVWNSKFLDTSKIGVYPFLGTIKGSSQKAKLMIKVLPAKKKFKVVLDAGHGGFDPGAVGPTGLKEKDVTLAITLKVGSILVKNGVETVYTRTTDNISWSTNQAQNLQARCDISNKAKPNYFVSIHANSFSQPSASGIETYYFTGSAAGQKIAQAVQTEILQETGRVDRKIKTTSGFYVIKNVEATSILVETAFISNPEEEKLLSTDAYRYKLAKAISTGILKSLGITNIIY